MQDRTVIKKYIFTQHFICFNSYFFAIVNLFFINIFLSHCSYNGNHKSNSNRFLNVFYLINLITTSFNWNYKSRSLGVSTCEMRVGFLDKSRIRTENCGHFVIVTTYITNIRIKQTTVNIRIRNGKLDSFGRRVFSRKIIGSENFFHDVVYQVCQIDSTSRTVWSIGAL